MDTTFPSMLACVVLPRVPYYTASYNTGILSHLIVWYLDLIDLINSSHISGAAVLFWYDFWMLMIKHTHTEMNIYTRNEQTNKYNINNSLFCIVQHLHHTQVATQAKLIWCREEQQESGSQIIKHIMQSSHHLILLISWMIWWRFFWFNSLITIKCEIVHTFLKYNRIVFQNNKWYASYVSKTSVEWASRSESTSHEWQIWDTEWEPSTQKNNIW